MFEVEGKDGVILTLGDGWSNSSLGTRGGFCRIVSLVWMFCGLGKVVKDYVVISRLCTKGSVHWAKWRLLVA
jgi:hypothetical protein